MTAPPPALPTEQYPTECECDVLLADGTVGHVRPIRPADAEALAFFHEHLSSETVYRRFFGAHPHLRSQEIDRFTRVDYRDRLALVAEVNGCLSAVARYDRLPRSDRAEVAFVVADSFQGHGLGTLLLEHLALAARRRGVAAFEAQTLATNRPMQDVFRQAGFDCQQRWNAGVLDVAFPIAPTQHYLEALMRRDALALRAWLGPKLGLASSGGLGLVCRTASTAEAAVAACRRRGIGLSVAVVTDELGIDLSAGLTYLATSAQTEVIAFDSTDLTSPRRVVAVTREAAKRRPVVALTPAARPTGWCEQAGAESVHRIEDLADRVQELLLEVRSDTWQPPARGELVETSGCDPSAARTVLDQAAPLGGRSEGWGRLAQHDVGDVLTAYGIPISPVGAWGDPDDWSLTLEERVPDGLTATMSSDPNGPATGIARLLPLTDCDVQDLAQVVEPADRKAVIDTLVRAARLIDDQPDIHRIQIPLGRTEMARHRHVEIWTGPARATNDDPFARRLPP